MKVSIAVATYNGEKYLREQLESFLNQTRQPDEVVISDDNSKDHTWEIINEFKLAAPFEVKVFRNGRDSGYTKNFENSLSKADGDLIFMCDQDDVWFKDKIERILEIAGDHPEVDVFVNDTEIVHSDLTPTGITKMDQIQAIGYAINSMVMGTCTAVRRRLLSVCLPIPDGFVGHDDWIHNIADILSTKMLVREVLQYYRIHDLNTSTYIVNTTDKINPFTHFIRSIKSNDSPQQRLQKQIKNKQLLYNWIQEKNIIRSDLTQKNKLQNLRVEIEIIQERLGIYQLNKIQRVIPVFKMFLKGRYNYFSSWKSVLKDLIA